MLLLLLICDQIAHLQTGGGGFGGFLGMER